MSRAPLLRAAYDLLPGELAVDNFAGGGGASTGIEAAIGRPVDIAINHDAEAIAMHRANHPETKHYQEDVWAVDPHEACGERPVGLLWASPDCTHFSRAKGTQPVRKEIRGLAWVVIRWAETVRPRVIILENVEEFQTWGPLLEDQPRPDPARAGETFREWLGQLTALGYVVEFRSMVAADYGTPTTRRRLFLVARRDGAPIVWPDATHGKGRALPWAPASEIIDWTLPCPSIFGRVRPLAEATLRRIAAGVRRYVVEADPFIIPTTHQGDARTYDVNEPLRTVTGAHRGEFALVEPFAASRRAHYGGVVGHRVDRALGTVTARDHHALTAAFLTKFYGTSTGSSAAAPLPTITANGKAGGHLAEVRAFLLKYYGAEGRDQAQQIDLPLHTVTTRARFGLVMVHGEAYEIADIGMRMLQPSELFLAQGFPDTYDIAPLHNGKPLTKTAQTRLAGNSVCAQVSRAIVHANLS